MRRPRVSDEERAGLLKRIDRKNAEEKRKGRLYNRYFRRSFLFIGSWAARLVCFIFFATAFIFDESSGGFRDEKILDTTTETYTTYSKWGTRTTTMLHITTNYDFYEAAIMTYARVGLKTGDTVQIERNIFGKAIFFTKEEWRLKYRLLANGGYYYVILFVSFISFLFNDGLDPFARKILPIISLVDLLAVIAYLVL